LQLLAPTCAYLRLLAATCSYLHYLQQNFYSHDLATLPFWPKPSQNHPLSTLCRPSSVVSRPLSVVV
jgi:hypothetical protein